MIFIPFLFLGIQSLTRSISPLQFKANVKLNCISYAPQGAIVDFDPHQPKDYHIDIHMMERQLKKIKTVTSCIRLYSIDFGGDKVIEKAIELGFDTIYLGVYFSDQVTSMKSQIDKTIEYANQYPQIKYILVGNEYHLKKYVLKILNFERRDFIKWFNYIKNNVSYAKVAISESYDQHFIPGAIPANVDFISVHIYPYWRGKHIDYATNNFVVLLNKLKTLFPNKEIHVTETGWPTYGLQRVNAVASKENQIRYLEEIKDYLESKNIPYVWFSAYDQPWKMKLTEGLVGGHWGLELLKSNNNRKYIYINFIIISLLLFFLSNQIILPGILSYVTGPLSCLVALFHIIQFEKIYKLGLLSSSFFLVSYFTFSLLAFILILYRILTLLNIINIRKNSYAESSLELVHKPLVSIHVATKNESYVILEQSINSLIAQNYENYEVIVVVNNTHNKKVYQSLVHRYSNEEKVSIYYQEYIQGFKAGALNFALNKTSKNAEFIAIIDADYKVEKDWLYYALEKIFQHQADAIQLPQDYQTQKMTFFQSLLYQEYRGFFQIGMPIRAKSNSIIHHGTMLMISKKSLIDVGCWNTASLVEDTDLGIRLQTMGYKTYYSTLSKGYGLLPSSFYEYCKQRKRWSEGAVRLFFNYLDEFFCKSNLKLKQKLLYLLDWAPWFLISFYPILVISVSLLNYKVYISENWIYDPSLALPFIYFILSEVLFSLSSYLISIRTNLFMILLNIMTGLSLVWSISLANLKAMFLSKMVFQVTNKSFTQTKIGLKVIMTTFLGFLPLIIAIMNYIKYINLFPALTEWLMISFIISAPSICQILMIIIEKISHLKLRKNHLSVNSIGQ